MALPANVPALLALGTIQHLYRATVIMSSGQEFDVVPVDRLDLTFDQDWSPYAQVSLTIQTPADAGQLAALDPLLGNRLRLRMGYRWAGTDWWETTPTTLRIQQKSQPLPNGTTTLSAMGLEMVPQDQYTIKEGATAFDNYKDLSGVDNFIQSFIRRGWEPGPKPPIVSTITGGTWGSNYVSGYKCSGESYWTAIEGVAQAVGLRVYDDGTGTFRIEWPPQLTTNNNYAAKFTTGPGGTITGGDQETDRGTWYNRVKLQFDWDWGDLGKGTLTGYADVSSGPYRAVAPNIREYVEFESSTEFHPSQQYMTDRARGLLEKFVRRGTSRSFTAAADYRIRPGQSIQVRMGAGAAWEAVLVAAVTFSPLTGSMSVTTTTPQDYEVGA